MNQQQRVALANLLDAQGLMIIAQLSDRYSADEYQQAEDGYIEMNDVFVNMPSDAEIMTELRTQEQS